MPDVVGQDLGPAKAQLGRNQLRLAEPVAKEPSQSRKGMVLSQNPEAGTKVKPGWLVYLTVSSGPPRVKVPRVVDLKFGPAREKLRQAHLGVAEPVAKQESNQPAGIVVHQNPEADAEVEAGSTVRLAVSSGRKVPVPRVLDLSLPEARRDLEQAELQLADPIAQEESEHQEGTVLRQRPEPGTRVQVQSAVTLVVSAGPPKVPVPRVVGLQMDRAIHELNAVDLKPDVEQRRDKRPQGEVISQKPGPGTKVPQKTQIMLKVSSGTFVPAVAGLNLKEAKGSLEQADLEVTEKPVESWRRSGTILRQNPGPGEPYLPGKPVEVEFSLGYRSINLFGWTIRVWPRDGFTGGAILLVLVILGLYAKVFNPPTPPVPTIRYRPRMMSGRQEIIFPERNLPAWELEVRSVPDHGTQAIEGGEET